MRTERRGVGGLGALAAATLCFASVPLFLKHFTGMLDAWTVNGVRYGVATLLWLPFVLRHRSQTSAGISVWRAAVVPALFNVFGQVGWALAPYYNDASIVAFVIRSSFLFTMLFGFWVLAEERRLARRPLFWCGVLAVAAGVAVMYGGGLRHGGTSPLGIAILLGTAAFWGAYAVTVRRYLAGYPARLSFGVICIYTTALLWVLMFLFGDYAALRRASPTLLAMVLVSGLVGIGLSHVCLYRAIHRLGPVVAYGASAVQPFLTALGALLVLGEVLTGLQWVGGLLLALGCVLLLFSKGLASAARATEDANA